MSVNQTPINQLITDNIDIWTSTVKNKAITGRGSSKKLELYGVKQLRELILELAVRGKLVPQDPTDEPAAILLERIAKEKAQLVKDKKISKTKKLPSLTEEEKSIDLPSGWALCRFGDIYHLEYGDNLPKAKRSGSGEYQVYGSNGVVGTHNNFSVDQACVVIGRKGSAGALNMSDTPCWVTDVAYSVIPPTGIKLNYCFLHLNTFGLDSLGKGIKPGLNRNEANVLVARIPPTAEQDRIVAKVDELMALCDQLEQQTEANIEAHQVLVTTLLDTLTNSDDADELMQNWARISEHFDTLFTTEESIDQLKQTILQLAVMGKLVPQDPNDEPAAKLLECIAEEKAQLIKDKKIKKQKALPPISDDEKPFELPKGWEWERIGNLSHFIEYGSSQKTVESLPNGVPVLKMGDIQNGKLILGEHKVMSSDVDELPNLYVKNNDVLYNRTNSAELVGKTGIYKGEDDKYSFASYLIRIRCNSANISPDYLNLSMNTPLFRQYQIEPHIKKQCGQANVNGTLMKSMLVSVPPLDEQVLIFNKVNELHKLCDQLKARVIESKVTQLRLTDSIVEQAV